MNKNRRTATAVGVLFFIATASYLVGSGLIDSAVKAPDYLANLDGGRILIGAGLEFINSAAVVGIGVLLFPTLRKHREGMALGYAGSRMIESTLLLVAALGPLLLLSLSQAYGQGGANAPFLQPLGTLATQRSDLAFQMAMVVLGAGSLMLCYVLYKARLVPRSLAVLGFVGYIALFASGWLEIAGFAGGAALYAPGAIFEILFPLWLIVKGFNSSAIGKVIANAKKETYRSNT